MSFRVFFRCVGEAVAARGLRALLGVVPFGEHLYDIGADALERWQRVCREQEMLLQVQQAAAASAAEVRQVVAAVVEEVKQAVPEARAELERPEAALALEQYLVQVPMSIRASLRRPRDPSGTSIPPGMTLRKPDQMLALLPGRPARFRPGDRPAGNWVLTELLGVGGFGEVWKGEHPTHKGIAPVALKFCLDAQAVGALRHEAALLDRVMQQGGRDGLVALRNLHDGEVFCLEYEYVGGGDLTGLLTDWRELPGPERVVRVGEVVTRIAGIVGAMHGLGPPIVHRDLKPANILLHRQAGGVDVRVADFGIGGLAAERSLTETRRGGTARGDLLRTQLRGAHTPTYASPQQEQGEDPDPRDDVHALGVIWYQLLVGDVRAKVGMDARAELGERGLSEAAIALLEACVSGKAARRPRDGRDLAERLAALGTKKTSPPGEDDEARKRLEAERQWRELEERMADNLRRWQESGAARAWVEGHRSGWDEREWQKFLAGLRATPLWPMKEAEVGAHLEALLAELLAAEIPPLGQRRPGQIITVRIPVPEPKHQPGELFILKVSIPDPKHQPGEATTLRWRAVPSRPAPAR